MSEAKFTEGPWLLLPVGEGFARGLVPCSQERQSLLTLIEEDGVDFAAVFNDADARLIAAAPELFEEMFDILRSIEGGGNVVTFGDVDIARYRALIAKALGEQS